MKQIAKFYRIIGFNRLADYLEDYPYMFITVATAGFIKGFVFFWLLTYFINW